MSQRVAQRAPDDMLRITRRPASASKHGDYSREPHAFINLPNETFTTLRVVTFHDADARPAPANHVNNPRAEMKSFSAVTAALAFLTFQNVAIAKEPVFPIVAEGTLPQNLKAIATTQAIPGEGYAIETAPSMCLSRLSVIVDAAGGTDRIKMYSTGAKLLNVSFQSYIDSEIRFNCVKGDGSVPDRHLYTVSFKLKQDDPKGFQDVLHRVAVALYGWDVQTLDKAFAACADKAKRNLQKDSFGVIPKVGMVKGLDCYLGGKDPHLTLYAPDIK